MGICMNACAPVLFLVFNRPEQTQQVFEAIRAARPERLYVAADGARPGRPGESERCAQVRQIATAVDWPCRLQTLLREQNLGCGRAVSEAISWFFSNEPEGIILEDDCLPAADFFRFTTAMLSIYRDDTRIGKIAGTNPLGSWCPDSQASHFFSSYGYSWGWASWRDRWQDFDLAMGRWPSFAASSLAVEYPFSTERNRGFEAVHRGELDTWDYPWHFALSAGHRLVVLPAVNLIRNLGFAADATHTRNTWSLYGKLMPGNLAPPYQAPLFLLPDRAYERAMYRLIAREGRREWLIRFLRRLQRLGQRLLGPLGPQPSRRAHG